jgi:hypothetical protein
MALIILFTLAGMIVFIATTWMTYALTFGGVYLPLAPSTTFITIQYVGFEVLDLARVRLIWNR